MIRYLRLILPSLWAGLFLFQLIPAALSAQPVSPTLPTLAAATAPADPVVARLDVLSTPTLGGSGQVIWAVIPNVTPQAADLVFTLRRGSSVSRQEVVHLKLAQSQPTERYFTFSAPDPGKYRLEAILFLRLNGILSKYNYALTLNLPAAGRPWLESLEPPAITPLAVNGFSARGDLPTSAAEAWFSFDVPTTATHTIEVVSGGSTAFSLALFGPNRQTTLITTDAGPRQLGAIPKITRRLGPGTYYLQARDATPIAGGAFQLQVCDRPIPTAPLRINGGSRQTLTPQVTLNSAFKGNPSWIMVSERPNFLGAVWLPYTTALQFTLSSGNGTKTLYCKVKDAFGGVSGVLLGAIMLNELVPLKVNGGVVINSITNQVSENWYTFTLATTTTVAVETSLKSLTDLVTRLYGPGSTTAYLAKARHGASGPVEVIKRQLGPGVYYIKVSPFQVGAQGDYYIRLVTPLEVTFFSLNCGETETTDRTVMLDFGINSQCDDTLVEYMVSERSDFLGAVWQPYLPLQECLLSEAEGPKRVYFKARDIMGWETPVVSDTITLKIPELKWGVAARGSLHWEPAGQANTETYPVGYWIPEPPSPLTQWYRFTLDRVTMCNIEIHSAYLDSYMRLFGPNDRTKLLAENDNGGEGNNSRITRTLEPGTYYIKVQAIHAYEQANFEIALNGDVAPRVIGFHISDARYSDAASGLITGRKIVASLVDVAGFPAQMMISESPMFSGAAWQSYTSKVSYTLSVGNGRKTIYYKVRDAAGVESPVTWATTLLNEAAELKPTTATLSGTISRAGQASWYEVSSAGDYKLEVQPGSLRDLVVERYPAGDIQNMLEMVEGTAGKVAVMARSYAYHQLIRVRAKSSSATGSYTIRLIPGQAPSMWDAYGGWGSTHQTGIGLDARGNPTQCMLSEFPDFRGAVWQPFREFINFTLSAGSGMKLIYIKVRNAAGFESDVYAHIAYVYGTRALTVDGAAVQDYAAHYAEDTDGLGEVGPSTFSFEVKTRGTYKLEMTGLDWLKDYTVDLIAPDSRNNKYFGSDSAGRLTALFENLSPGKYTLQVSPGSYIIDDDAYMYGGIQMWYSGRFWIRVSRDQGIPVLTQFSLNGGNEEAVRREVLLTHTCLGTPAQFMASESPTFAGATWQAYRTPLKFTLSAGDGTKTVYLKLKNASGKESNVLSDTIIYRTPIPLGLDGPKQHGISGEYWYALTLSKAGKVRIDLGGSMWITKIIAPDGFTEMSHDDFQKQLNPGTYSIRLESSFERVVFNMDFDEYSDVYYYGPYTIRAVSVAQ